MSKITKVTVKVDLVIVQKDGDETNIEDILNDCGYEFRTSPYHEENGVFIEYSDMWDYTIKSTGESK